MTTISTSSENLFSKIQKYLKNKRVYFVSSFNNEVYTPTIFNTLEHRNILSHQQNDQSLSSHQPAGVFGSCRLTHVRLCQEQLRTIRRK